MTIMTLVKTTEGWSFFSQMGKTGGKIRLRSISWGLCRSMNSGGLSGNVRLVVENESWTNLQIQKSLA